MNNDLISRSALMELARNHIGRTVDCNDIARFPGVDAELVRHGRWYQKRMSVPKGKGQTYLVWGCSLCHKHEKKRSDYYPNCGAKMDGDANEAD